MNSSGYLGNCQFGEPTLSDLGYIVRTTRKAAIPGIPGRIRYGLLRCGSHCLPIGENGGALVTLLGDAKGLVFGLDPVGRRSRCIAIRN